MSADSYKVEQHPHGVLIFGGMPASDFTALVAAWKEHGLTIVDDGISSALGASWCVTSPEGSKLWRAEVDAKATASSDGNREVEWLLGTDTGLSSVTLLWAFGKSRLAVDGARNRLRGSHGNPPGDTDDFGRCYRLLSIFPEWRAGLLDITFPCRLSADWRPLRSAWPELEYLYRKTETGDEVASRRASAEFNRRMQEMRSEP